MTFYEVSVWDIINLKKSYSFKSPDKSNLKNIAMTSDRMYLAMAIQNGQTIIQVKI